MAALQAGITIASRPSAVSTTEMRLGSASPGVSARFPQLSSSRVGIVKTRKHENLQTAAHLGWANSGAFGVNSARVSWTTVNSIHGESPRRGTVQVSAFTREQSKLVKESWKLLQKNNPGEIALNFFLKVFEVAPSVKRMFSFLRESDVPLEKNPHLKVHALTVLSMTGQAATQLGEKGALDKLMPKLMELGHTHVAYGVVDEHFDVVKYALLTTLTEALPKEFNADVRAAWAAAYDAIVQEIKEKMRLEREGAAPKHLASV